VLRALLIGCIAALTVSVSNAASRPTDLDTWVESDLVPYLRQQLSSLPRFRNESFRFVVLADDKPQSEGTALAMALRDHLRDAVSDLPGIRVAWQAEQPGVGLVAGATSLDCTRNDANYFIGIELLENSPGNVTINVRTLDVEERTWVAGLARSWQGAVDVHQRRQLMQYVADPTFRGERHAPWQDSETDLMAADLAYELGCQLLGQVSGEYVLAAVEHNGEIDATTALVELVTNNLAGTRALQFSAAGDAINAVIEGKAHRIDDDLFQYWVTITPTTPGSEMLILSADAYVRIPDRYKAATLVPEASYELPQSPARTLSEFSVVRLRDQRSCVSGREYSSVTGSGRPYGYGAGDCYALEVGVESDAVVFFLNHQLNYGLVRLADERCTQRSLAKVARADRQLRFPLPLDALQSGDWSASDHWSLDPSRDTYFVLAASDTKAARALSQHIEKLPRRCSASVRDGIEGEALRDWLEELAAIARHWSPSIDWRGIRVKDVY